MVNYFFIYNNIEVIHVSCGGFHSFALLKNKNYENINIFLDESYIFEYINIFFLKY